jgi:tetratricopeptide (TPR) repeat protein
MLRAYLVRGIIQAHRGKRAAAVNDLTEAIRLDWKFTAGYRERGLVFLLQGEYDRALADCTQLIALEPCNAAAYAQRSVAYHFKGDVSQSLSDYARALQLDPHAFLSRWDQGLAETAPVEALTFSLGKWRPFFA